MKLWKQSGAKGLDCSSVNKQNNFKKLREDDAGKHKVRTQTVGTNMRKLVLTSWASDLNRRKPETERQVKYSPTLARPVLVRNQLKRYWKQYGQRIYIVE